MTISYAITVCNEITEIIHLFSILTTYKNVNDEIVVLFDKNNGSDSVREFLESKQGEIKLIQDYFDGDFASWKNLLNSHCDGDFIFQLDADEYIQPAFIENIHSLLRNLDGAVDLICIPRINTVDGITDSYIKKWRWNILNIFNLQCINFPDYQTRLYKNRPSINWEGKVHERITGMNTYSYLPPEEVWCIRHHKTISRQIQQNSLYAHLST